MAFYGKDKTVALLGAVSGSVRNPSPYLSYIEMTRTWPLTTERFWAYLRRAMSSWRCTPLWWLLGKDVQAVTSGNTEAKVESMELR